MKTIEEKACEFRESDFKKYGDRIMEDRIKDAFISGIEVAQQWISVDDELPELEEIVLVKTDKGCVCTAYLHGKKSGFITYGEDAFVEFGEIKFWRPIELKKNTI